VFDGKRYTSPALLRSRPAKRPRVRRWVSRRVVMVCPLYAIRTAPSSPGFGLWERAPGRGPPGTTAPLARLEPAGSENTGMRRTRSDQSLEQLNPRSFIPQCGLCGALRLLMDRPLPLHGVSRSDPVHVERGNLRQFTRPGVGYQEIRVPVHLL